MSASSLITAVQALRNLGPDSRVWIVWNYLSFVFTDPKYAEMTNLFAPLRTTHLRDHATTLNSLQYETEVNKRHCQKGFANIY